MSDFQRFTRQIIWLTSLNFYQIFNTFSLFLRGVGCIFVELITGLPAFPGAKESDDQIDQIFRVSTVWIMWLKLDSSYKFVYLFVMIFIWFSCDDWSVFQLLYIFVLHLGPGNHYRRDLATGCKFTSLSAHVFESLPSCPLTECIPSLRWRTSRRGDSRGISSGIHLIVNYRTSP